MKEKLHVLGRIACLAHVIFLSFQRPVLKAIGNAFSSFSLCKAFLAVETLSVKDNCHLVFEDVLNSNKEQLGNCNITNFNQSDSITQM